MKLEVTAMVSQGEPKRMTVDEWLEYDDVPEGFHAELVDGEIVMNPLAGFRHQAILDNLNFVFIPYRLAHPDRIRRVLSPARLPIPGVPEGREPDMALYAEEPQDPDSSKAWKQIKPFLVIEVVSPHQEKRDHVEKYSSYHRAEIPEYWILDPRRRELRALRWTPEQWEEQSIRGQGTYTTPLLPGLTVQVEDLWR